MSETVTLQQIAEALAVTKSAATKRAARQGWAYTEVRGVVGGIQRRYPVAGLPEDVQQALSPLLSIDRQRSAAASVPDSRAEVQQLRESQGEALAERVATTQRMRDADRRVAKQQGIAQFAALAEGDPKKERAHARERVLRQLWEYRRSHRCTLDAGCRAVAQLCNQGELPLPESTWDWLPQRHGARALTAASLKRWHYAHAREGIWGLVDGYGNRAGDTKVQRHPELYAIVLGAMARTPHISPRDIHAYLQAAHPELPEASEACLRRFMRTWKQENAQLWSYVSNPDRYKNVYMAAAGSHQERIERLNQLWELDSTPGDWLLSDGRHSVVGLIDMKSRRVRLYVSKTSTASAVCQVMRRGIQAFGVPEAVRTDNGKDYVSEQLETVLADLEIGHEVCLPFASEQKGTVERMFRTMSHGILDLLPGFIGHNVAERKVIEARQSFAERVMTPGETVEVAMSSGELQEVLDKWTEVYHHTPHSGLEGVTPFEVAIAHQDETRWIHDDRALDLLLAPVAGTRTIGKKGIAFDRGFYDAPELFEHVGREALLRFDEQDIGRLYVYVDGRFVAVAECAERLGISRKERAAAAKAAQSKLMREQAAELKAFKKDVAANIPEVVLNHRLEQAANVEILHGRRQEHTSDGLREAARASRASLPPETPVTDRPQIDRAALAAQMATPTPAAVVPLENPKARYQRWLGVDARVQAGLAVSEDELRWHARYPNSDEYRAMKDFYEEFRLHA